MTGSRSPGTPLDDMVPGASEASVYLCQRKTWCVGTFAGFSLAGDLLVNFRNQPSLPPGTTVLASILPRKDGPPTLFVSVLEEAPARWKLMKPRVFPYVAPEGTDHASRRKNFRVNPTDESPPPIFFHARKSKKNSPGYEAELLDVSAGGLGLAVTEDVLQRVGLEDKFTVPLHLGLGLEGGSALTPEDVPCVLCNARPLDRQILLGFRFELESLDEPLRERLVTRILHYVAARQRRALQHRTKTKDGD